MDLVELVRDRADGAPLPRDGSARPAVDAWRAAEGAVLTEALGGGGERLVAAYEQLAEWDGRDEPVGRAARLRASYDTHRGRHEASLEAAAVAMDLLRGAARDGARLGRAASLLRLGRFVEAIEDCRVVRRRARRRGEGLFAAAALLNQAVAVHEGGDPRAALALYRKVLRETTELGDTYYRATASQNLANALVLLERFEEAVPLYGAARTAFEGMGLRREAAVCRYNEGALAVGTGKLGRADDLLQEAEDELRSCGDLQHAALCRLDRGEALLRAHLLPEAHHCLATAERALRSSAPPGELSRAVLLLARTELARGDLDRAEELLEEDLPLESDAVLATRLELSGRRAALAGDSSEATRLLLAAADAHGRDRPAARCRALAAAAQASRADGMLDEGRELALRAERVARRVSLPGPRFAAASARFLCEADLGRRRAARGALTRAIDALEDVRAGLGPVTLRAGLLLDARHWLAAAIRFELARGPAAALALAERWRARSLIDLLERTAEAVDADSGSVGDADGDDEVARLRARVSRLERDLGAVDDGAGLRRGAGAPPSLRALRLAERRLATAVRRRSAVSLHPAARTSLDEATVARLRAEPGTTCLAFHTDERGTVVFVLDDGPPRHVTIALSRDAVAHAVEELQFRLGRYALGELVQRHRARLDAAVDRRLRVLAEPLHRALRRELVGTRRLVVVPDGPWQRVPFAALPWSGGRLVDAHEVLLAPTVVGARGVASSPGSRHNLVLGHDDGRAPEIVREAQAVAELLHDAGEPVELALGADANSDRVLPTSAPRCLHIAAHGRFRADAPEQSGLRLADGWLRALDLAETPLAGTTVVLSGCETGVSRTDAGGEPTGLVRAVLAAGATELVVSQWRVDDRTTAELMVEFHRRRLTGADATTALNEAQRDRARAGDAPFQWAGFSVWTASAARVS